MSDQPASRLRTRLARGSPDVATGAATDFASLARNALFHLSIGFALALAAGLGLAYSAVIDPVAAARGAAIFCALAGLVLLGLSAHPHRRFGPANLLTTLRAVVACTLAALVLEIGELAPAFRDRLMWGVAGVAIVAVALDGIDGFIARRRREASSFGARYDMEVDAFLILVLCVFAFMLDKAGAWVLGIGFLRYAFVAAGRLLPWINAELPPSQRRKFICAVQGVVLCLVVSPPLMPPVSSILSAWILVLLVWSFACDLVWLWRRA